MKKIIYQISHENLQNLANHLLGSNEKNNSEQDSEELLDVSQAANLIKLAKSTLYGLVHKKKIPHCKQGKKLYFYKSELLDWVSSGRKSTTQDLDQKANDYLFNNKIL